MGWWDWEAGLIGWAVVVPDNLTATLFKKRVKPAVGEDLKSVNLRAPVSSRPIASGRTRQSVISPD